jgi:hypothetical protein
MEASAAHVAVVAATREAASNRAAAITATVTGPSIPVPGPSIPVTAASVETAAIAIKATAISVAVATEPRAGSDKEATAEPGRTIVSVGRAGVGIVAVVAIVANGGITISPVHRATDPYSHGNLSMGNCCRGEQQDTQYSEIT